MSLDRFDQCCDVLFDFAVGRSKILSQQLLIPREHQRYLCRLYLKALLASHTYNIHVLRGTENLIAPRKLLLILECVMPTGVIQLIYEMIRPMVLGTATLWGDFTAIDIPPPELGSVLKNGVLVRRCGDPSYIRTGFPFHPEVFYSLEHIWRGCSFTSCVENVTLVPSPLSVLVQRRTLEVIDFSEYSDDRQLPDWVVDGQPSLRFNDLDEEPEIRFAPHGVFGPSEETRLLFVHALCPLRLEEDSVPTFVATADSAARERLNQQRLLFSEHTWFTTNPLTGHSVPTQRATLRLYLRSLITSSDYRNCSATFLMQLLCSRIGFIVDDVIFPVVGQTAVRTGNPAPTDGGGRIEKRKRTNRIRSQVKKQASENPYGRSVVIAEPPG